MKIASCGDTTPAYLHKKLMLCFWSVDNMAQTLLVFAVLAIHIFHSALCGPINPISCPFDNNNGCTCEYDSNVPYTFRNVTCQPSDDMKPFNNSIGTYSVDGELLISIGGRSVSIPAGAFLAFKTIERLRFVNTETEYVRYLDLDPQAFAGVEIFSLSLYSFSNVLPLPDAIRNAGASIRSLEIELGYNSALGPKEFKNFPNLATLYLDRCLLTSLDDTAFDGLESSLVNLTMKLASLAAYPDKALQGLKILQNLDLTGNRMQTFSEAAFAPFGDLRELILAGNNISAALEAGAFDQFPSKIEHLDLSTGQIQSVPTSVLASAPSLSWLSLATNNIKILPKGAFPDNNNLIYLDLSANPFPRIDADTFASLKKVEHLILNEDLLLSLDLSMLNGVAELETLEVSAGYLNRATISSIDQVRGALIM